MLDHPVDPLPKIISEILTQDWYEQLNLSPTKVSFANPFSKQPAVDNFQEDHAASRQLDPGFTHRFGGRGTLFSATRVVGEPTSDLAPKDAVRLIAMKSSVPADAIEISFILDRSAKCWESFEVKHVRRVAAIHAVRESGSQSRRLVFYDLF